MLKCLDAAAFTCHELFVFTQISSAQSVEPHAGPGGSDGVGEGRGEVPSRAPWRRGGSGPCGPSVGKRPPDSGNPVCPSASRRPASSSFSAPLLAGFETRF